MSNVVLNDAQIRSAAPAVFAEAPAPFMSSEYGFVKTSEALTLLRGEGYEVVRALQDHARRRDPNVVRHALTLRHTDNLLDPAQVGGLVPQILLINSHNGRTRLSMRAGFYRYICSNGLVVGNDMAYVAVRHTHSLASQIIDQIKQIAQVQNKVLGLIDRWQNTTLTDSQAHDFARAAAVVRFGEQAAKGYLTDDILSVRRPEDDGNTLWQVFNRIQENTTQAGLHGRSANGRVIAARTLTGITQNTAYNEALWSMAEEFVTT
jgi:hypothetical protein